MPFMCIEKISPERALSSKIIPTKVDQRKQCPPPPPLPTIKRLSTPTNSMWRGHSISQLKKKQQQHLLAQIARNRVSKPDGKSSTLDLVSNSSSQWKSTHIPSKEEKIRNIFPKRKDLLSKMSPRLGVVDALMLFRPGPMGIRFKGNRIISVSRGSQAETMGICVGWQILAVNGVMQPNDGVQIDKAIDKTYRSEKPTHILFKVVYPENKRLPSLLLDNRSSKTLQNKAKKTVRSSNSSIEIRFSSPSTASLSSPREGISPSTSPETSPLFRSQVQNLSPSTSPNNRYFRRSAMIKNQNLIDSDMNLLKYLNTKTAFSKLNLNDQINDANQPVSCNVVNNVSLQKKNHSLEEKKIKKD